ncbi:MAG: heavy metal translocating P-type ATPase [Erysipelotrichia bacterium]|nr:heavy metal translocating P-type ATPase [Erysipelotrichia bacterium]
MKTLSQFFTKHKTHITFISAGLLISAYFSLFALKNNIFFTTFLIIASIIGVIPIAYQAFQALRVKVISIDVLVSIAVIAAFMIGEFQESAIVTFLFLFGSYLEAKTLNHTRQAIKNLLDLAPLTALRLDKNQDIEEVSVDEVEIDDVCLVKTGLKVPVDGIVLSGQGVINEASITGESMPVSKQINDWVYAGTILENGTLTIQTKRVGEDTTFGQIIELVEEAQDSKTSTQRFIDRFSKYYTPFVLLLSIIVGIVTQEIETAIIILVLGCPGALVIGVPISAVSGIGNGATHGVLFKGSEVIQTLSKVDTIVFDKTGTLTQGSPEVVEAYYFMEDQEVLNRMIVSIERESTHPLAQAMVKHLSDFSVYPIKHTEVFAGEGIKAIIENQELLIGNMNIMDKFMIDIQPSQKHFIQTIQSSGASLVMVAFNQRLSAIFGILDPLRESLIQDLKHLKASGIKQLILLSGDHQESVDHVAKNLCLNEALGHMLPSDKAQYIKKLQSKHKIVAFVGDGVNDSPSLASADIGIAMGSGTDVAIETSEVVLMKSDFKHLVHAIGLSKAMMRNMLQNIVIAIAVVIFLISNVFLSEWMNMSIGMLVHELSILVVIVNGMRLLKYKERVK